jgi:hypothetical protein
MDIYKPLEKEFLMADYNSSRGPLEVDSQNPHALISVRSIVSGLLVAMFTMTGLLGLGLAFGGIGLDQETTAKSAGIFSGVWFIVSTLLSIFVGSYFAARISKFRTARIGSAQGLVIASLFLGFFLYQTVSAIGSAGSAVSSMLGSTGSMVAQGARKAASTPAVTNAVDNLAEDALADLNLRSEPTVVARGIGSRLIQGDTEGAKNYLARQSGITPTEADTRIAQMKAQVDKVVSDTKEATATALRSTGWALFLLVALGALAAMGGGALGSAANYRKPLIREREREDFYARGQHA